MLLRASFSPLLSAGPMALRGLSASCGRRRFTTATASAFSDPKYAQLQHRLSALPKKKITFEELASEAAKCNVTRAELESYVDSLHRSGKVFHFRQAGVDFVFLDTRVITNTLSGLLDPTGVTVREMVAKKSEQLQTLNAEMEQLETMKRLIELRAERSVRRIMWGIVSYMTVQTVVVTRLTFWDLSWDIMEPICYINSVVIGAMGVWWFGLTKSDPTYKNTWEVFNTRRSRRFARKLGFDEARYISLKNEIAQTQFDLNLWKERQ